MARRRQLAADLLAVGFGLVLALVAGELVLRAFWPQRSALTIGMFRKDPDAGFRLREGYRNEVRTPEFRTAIVIDGS